MADQLVGRYRVREDSDAVIASPAPMRPHGEIVYAVSFYSGGSFEDTPTRIQFMTGERVREQVTEWEPLEP